MITITMPEHVRRIIETLYKNGFEAFAVGGCVRDALLGRTPNDWDITTSARPQQVKALFPRTIDTGIQHGTVTVMMDHVGYEVTTYRIDGEYEDGRHPKEVTFTANLIEDLKRRDFTINAMAYNDQTGLVDAFDGEGDLKRGVIRCVGVPQERFGEDALRMMRAIRFAAQLGFTIDEPTREAVKELAPTLKKVSAERIQAELSKLLVSNHPEEIRTAWELGLTAVFMPEFDVMMATPQLNKHHCYTVGEHSIHAVCDIRADRILRYTMLLHDVGKPDSRSMDEEGQEHYYGHAELGEQMARKIFRRLKMDNDTITKCCALIRWHDDRPDLTWANVRRAINYIGQEQFPVLFEVKRSDIHAQAQYRREQKLGYVEDFARMYEEVISRGECVSIHDLAVNGSDLLALGVPQGKEVGRVLQGLFEQVLENPEMNNRELLLEIVLKQQGSR